jgi:hypothetical protein
MHSARSSRGLGLALLTSFALVGCEPQPEDGAATDPCAQSSCPSDSTCRVVADAAFCDCNDGFVGSAGASANRCSPAVVDNGTCEDTTSGVVCQCDEGFEQPRNTIGCAPIFYECDDLECGENAICRMYSAGAVCECATNYEGDGYVCTPKAGFDPCNPRCGEDATCGADAQCRCDAGYFGDGFNCYPEETAGGRCTLSGGAITCECNVGYEHARPEIVACTDIDECERPDQSGCEAWCTNTEGSFLCRSTVADEESPYWENSCDPDNVRHQPQTQLAADCRCGANMTPDNDSPMGMCWRPITAGTGMARPYRYGTGPAINDIVALTPEVFTMVMHQPSRKLYLGVGYTWAAFGINAAYTGAIIEMDVDTGNRRIVAGFWPDEFGGTHHPVGMDMMAMTGLTHLPEVQNMVFGPDGETLFVWVQDHYSNAQVLKVNRITGAMEHMWAEHLVLPLEARHNLPEHGQCWNGERVSGRNFVQINNRGFAMDRDGNYLLTVVANSAANWISPTGVVKISADGTTCEWVRRTGAGPNNAYFDGTPGGSLGVGSDPIDVDCDGTADTANGFVPLDAKFYAPVPPCNSGLFAGGNKGSGAAPAVGSPFRALQWVNGKLWAFDANTYGLWEIDTEFATGWRVRKIGDNLAEDWIVEDTARDVVWLAGTGSENNLGAFHFDENPDNRWWQRVSPVCGAMPGPFPCLRGPMSTYATLHQPIVLDLATGYLIAQHGPGTVLIEPETGNTMTFSL